MKKNPVPSVLAFIIVIALAGCPLTPEDAEYAVGFADGFAEDDWYWQGYDDSYNTVDFGPILYQGGSITYVESPPYDAGYWDGVWYAYNDGYFVAYDYAFTIGFSEGYDVAYQPDFLEFLANDEHTEYSDGGWSDGYNDGFSEGRCLGACDYESGYPFDWLDALLFYRDGNDVYFEEVDVGTGAYGPVYLYEYGTDPAAKNGVEVVAGGFGGGRSVRLGGTNTKDAAPADFEPPALSYRPLIADVEAELRTAPEKSPRSERELTLETTWLERVQSYRANVKSAKPRARRARAVR